MEKRTLSNFREHLRKQEDDIKFPISGMFIFSKIVEKQNLKLLEKIAEKKFADPDEREFFVEQFHKVSYHIPEEAENKGQEKLQVQLQKFIK
tara:strand:- start:3 stop:278 length:276 start_codon:yes stop_codon:yes gene_type:complete